MPTCIIIRTCVHIMRLLSANRGFECTHGREKFNWLHRSQKNLAVKFNLFYTYAVLPQLECAHKQERPVHINKFKVWEGKT